MSMDLAEADEKDEKDADAVEEFAALMENDIFPILQKEMEREKYSEVVYKFGRLENELHMRKMDENLEEEIEKLEKVRDEVDASYLRMERTKEAVAHEGQYVQEISDNFMGMAEAILRVPAVAASPLSEPLFRACQRVRENRDAREHE